MARKENEAAMNKALVVGGFVAALVGVGLLSGSVTPIAYGASEANTQTVGSGIFGGLLSIGGAITSLFQLFKGNNSGTLKTIEDMLGGMIGKTQTAETITAEIALVALAGLCVKSGDVANLAKVGELSTGMLGKK